MTEKSGANNHKAEWVLVQLKAELRNIVATARHTGEPIDPERIAALTAAPAASEGEDGAVALLEALLAHIDAETCTHEETHRGGAIWTICDGCGRQWADDRGGFKPHEDAPAVAAARAFLERPAAQAARRVTEQDMERALAVFCASGFAEGVSGG